jgi:exodeoxyribonuclease VII small subunit
LGLETRVALTGIVLPTQGRHSDCPILNHKEKIILDKTLEQNLSELDDITRAMSAENINLDDSLALYERASAIILCANTQIKNAELKIENIENQKTNS